MTLRRLLAAPAAFAVGMTLAGPAQAATFGPAIPLPASGFYMGLGDLNLDGNVDMVQTHFNSSASVYTGDGDGTFTVRSPLTVGTSANDAVIADFTTDNSKPDIAVINFDSLDVTTFVNLTATAGDAPTFDTPDTNPVGGLGKARNTTAAADFDNSGTLDLAVPTFSNNTASVMLGNGEGLLLTPAPFATGGSLGQMAATGDLNADFKPDIVVANFSSGNVSSLLNTTAGPISFGAAQTTLTGTGARAVAIGNFDGDANGDVAVVNESAQNLSVLIGNGDGTFDPAVNHTIGTGTAGVAIDDLDADGKQDIVVSKSNGVGVFDGNGNGTFQPIDSLAGAGNSDIATADLNNDSKPDIVTDSQVFLNTTGAGGGGGGGGGGGADGEGAVAGVSASGQGTLPPPQLRKTANASVVNGVVKIKQPGQRSFRTLADPAQIRMGSIIDATSGRVRITTAAGGGKTQTAEFYEGIFKITQTKGKRPVTDVTLMGKLAGCSSKKASAAARKKRRGRRLWGSGKGRFRTKGKRSSALVRGTIWLVEDRCNKTTLTRVRKGVVQVRDFARKRNVTLRAGRSYTAPGRKR